MSELRFDGAPLNGDQVAIAPSGSAVAPWRVTVTRNGELVKDLSFTLKADAQKAYDEESRLIHANRT